LRFLECFPVIWGFSIGIHIHYRFSSFCTECWLAGPPTAASGPLSAKFPLVKKNSGYATARSAAYSTYLLFVSAENVYITICNTHCMSVSSSGVFSLHHLQAPFQFSWSARKMFMYGKGKWRTWENQRIDVFWQQQYILLANETKLLRPTDILLTIPQISCDYCLANKKHLGTVSASRMWTR